MRRAAININGQQPSIAATLDGQASRRGHPVEDLGHGE